MPDNRADVVVAGLARGRRVETMVQNIARSALTPVLKDLCQTVYEVLLRYDPQRLSEIEAKGEMNYFIARIVLNQYRSVNSPFHMEMRKFSMLSEDIEGHDYEYKEK